jgi:hypothetical protein
MSSEVRLEPVPDENPEAKWKAERRRFVLRKAGPDEGYTPCWLCGKSVTATNEETRVFAGRPIARNFCPNCATLRVREVAWSRTPDPVVTALRDFLPVFRSIVQEEIRMSKQ